MQTRRISKGFFREVNFRVLDARGKEVKAYKYESAAREYAEWANSKQLPGFHAPYKVVAI